MSIIILFTFVRLLLFRWIWILFSFSSPTLASHSLHFIEREEIFLPFRFLFHNLYSFARKIFVVCVSYNGKAGETSREQKLHIFHFISNERKEKNAHMNVRQRLPFLHQQNLQAPRARTFEVLSLSLSAWCGNVMRDQNHQSCWLHSHSLFLISFRFTLYVFSFFGRPFFRPSLFSLFAVFYVFRHFFTFFSFPPFKAQHPFGWCLVAPFSVFLCSVRRRWWYEFSSILLFSLLLSSECVAAE